MISWTVIYALKYSHQFSIWLLQWTWAYGPFLVVHHYTEYQPKTKCTVNVLKNSNASRLPKRPRQTAQTLIRLLLKKQSDQGMSCLLFWQAFCEFHPWKQTFYLWTEKEVFEILGHLPYHIEASIIWAATRENGTGLLQLWPGMVHTSLLSYRD